MRAQLDRVETLERATGTGRPPLGAIHHHFYAPSESGPLLVGAHGPIVPGRPDIKPIEVDREAGESEEAFLCRIEFVFAGASIS